MPSSIHHKSHVTPRAWVSHLRAFAEVGRKPLKLPLGLCRGLGHLLPLSVFAMLLCSSPARCQNSNKRCYSVDEPFQKGHYPKTITEIKPIEHCYSDKDHPYRYSIVDVPVSLATGTVRTPEFSPRKTSWHWIMVQVEKPLPTEQIGCMMAVADDSPQSWRECPLSDRLLRADWTVWEDGVIASNGSSATHADAKYTRDSIFKFLGKFPALAGKKYMLEVKFTKDGTPLNVANPHLIITKIGDE